MNLVKAPGNGYKEGLDASTGVAGTWKSTGRRFCTTTRRSRGARIWRRVPRALSC